MMWQSLAVTLGGGIGAVLRFWMGGWINRQMASTFPWGTLAVNILGGFVMGLIVEAGARAVNLPLVLRTFLTVGILGGFTTFSSFSLEVVAMFKRGEPHIAGLYIAASVMISVMAVFVGMWTIERLAPLLLQDH